MLAKKILKKIESENDPNLNVIHKNKIEQIKKVEIVEKVEET